LAEELGYQTGQLPGWGQFAEEAHETNPDLMWPKWIDVADRMRSEDSQIGSVLRAVTQPILSTEWSVDPSGAEDDVVEHIATDFGLGTKGVEYVAPLRTRGRFSFTEHIRLALLELPHGHSVFEQVYRLEDGRLRLAKLAWRPPRTITKFTVERDGGLKSISQYGAIGSAAEVKIPVDRLVVYVNEREGANWLGRSLLRPAYKNWMLKDRLLRVQAIAAERNGLGMPTYTGAPAPEKASTEEARAWDQDQVDKGLDVTKKARAGEAAGLSIPGGASFDFKGVTGKVPDTDPMIRYHDEQMARAVLAHFLNLGTETGSWALGSTFADFFTNSLNGVAQQIADVLNQHVVEDLVDRNYGPTVRAPRIVPAKIGAQHPATAEAIRALLEAGAITADDKLEAHLRNLYGLPPLEASMVALGVPVETVRAMKKKADDARAIAETAQKVYLATDKPPLTQEEARQILRDAGADLSGAGPDVSRIPSTEPAEEAS
jgi:hypothetical protein